MKLSQEMIHKSLTLKKFYLYPWFSSSIEPRYSINLIKIKDKEYIEIEFELSGDVKITDVNIINDNEQIIFIIKGRTNQSFEDEVYNGSKEFEFQPIIKRFINLPEVDILNQSFFDRIFGKDKNEKKKQYEIIILKEDNINNIIKKDNSQFGIYTIQIPIQRIETNKFKENEESTISYKG
jgi:hypothetical protein